MTVGRIVEDHYGLSVRNIVYPAPERDRERRKLHRERLLFLPNLNIGVI